MKYLEVTGKQIVDAAKGCGDIPPYYFTIRDPELTVKVEVKPFEVWGKAYHKVIIRGHWDASIPEAWFKMLEEEVKKDV